MKKDKISKRDCLKAGALLIGAGIFASQKAKASTPGTGDAALAAIATNTLNTWESLKQNVNTVNKHLGKAEEIRQTATATYDIALAARNFDKLVYSQIDSIKKKFERFYRVGKDPVNNPIPRISIENEPLVKFGRHISLFYENISKQAKNDKESRYKATLSGRNRASLELAKVQAKETRKNMKRLMKESLATPLDNKTTGEIYRDNSQPLRDDIEMQKLESQLRLEQAVIEFIEELRTGKVPEAKNFDTETFKKSYQDMKNGDGVLI